MRGLLLAVLVFPPVAAHADGADALDQLFAAQASMAGSGGSLESASAASRHAFAEHSSAGAVRLGGRAGQTFAAELPPITPPTYQARAQPLKAVYKANAEEKDKGPGWDYDKTMKASAFGLVGAAIGFALGGPIGAAAGFLVGFFIGALFARLGSR